MASSRYSGRPEVWWISCRIVIAAAEELVGQDDSDISNVRIALAQAAQRVLEERGLPIPEGLDVLMED